MKEVGDLDNLRKKMDSKGVLVAEVLTDAGTTSKLKNYAGAQYNYLLLRTDPMKQLLWDFGSDLTGYPTLTVVDLQKMKVLRTDCFYQNWESCVGDFL